MSHKPGESTTILQNHNPLPTGLPQPIPQSLKSRSGSSGFDRGSSLGGNSVLKGNRDEDGDGGDTDMAGDMEGIRRKEINETP